MTTIFDQSIVMSLSPQARVASVLFDTASIAFGQGTGRHELTQRAPLRIIGKGEDISVYAHGFLSGAESAVLRVRFGKSATLKLKAIAGNWAAQGTIKLDDNAETVRVRLIVDAPKIIAVDKEGLFTLDSLDLTLPAKS